MGHRIMPSLMLNPGSSAADRELVTGNTNRASGGVS